MGRVTVSIARAGSYEPAVVRAAVREVLAPLGGMAAFVSRGDRVLVKPNFLLAKAAQSAVTTHPEIILAVCEQVLEAGAASVTVGDSPGFGSGVGAARKIGLVERARAAGIEVIDFASPVQAGNPAGRRFKRFEIERTVLEADKIISLPKLKTHMQMFMTLAVKNTFGCVVGVRKGAWHFEAGRDNDLFAEMITDLHYFVKPTLSLLDGIVMMEGNGPGNGRPRDLGLLFASTDGVALDRAVCRVLSLPAEQLYTHQAAVRMGHGVPELADVDWAGVPPDEVTIAGIRHPRLVPVGDFYVPELLRRFAQRLVEVRPVVDPRVCSACGICVKQCPAAAVSLEEKARPRARIDQRLCIHCYCCQEICPEGAIRPKRGWARALLRKPG